MAVLRSLAPLAGLFAYALAGDPKSCNADLPMSCHNETIIEDTCCFIPAGQLLLTQFWDADPPTGPSGKPSHVHVLTPPSSNIHITDSWTIHGLWPDYCDGSFPAECDSERAYTNITDILTAFGADDTLSAMQRLWKDYQGDDESFWQHEWGKHGTCVSTLEPRCYDNYEPTQELVPYFARAVDLHTKHPTHEWLSAAGITPSESETYELSKIQSVLSGKHGAEVTLGCDGEALNEVWYHFNVKGSLQEGEFAAAEPSGTDSSSCPDQVSYPPKSGSNSTAMPVRRLSFAS